MADNVTYTRRDMPADISVFSGNFASQPLAFAHLLDVAPNLDLTHVEVIQNRGFDKRLSAYFDASTVSAIQSSAKDADTLILILPAAHDTHDCPIGTTAHLTALGAFRGTVPRMVAI